MKTFCNHLTSLAFAFVGFVASFCHSTAQADLITFAYEGTIDQTGRGGAAFDAFFGEAFRLEYTFESTTLDSDSNPVFGTYLDPTGTTTLTIGSNTYSSGVRIFILDAPLGDDDHTDVYSVGSDGPVTGPLIGGSVSQTFLWRWPTRLSRPFPAIACR